MTTLSRNLKHTFGRRLRAASVPRETRTALPGHWDGNITTHDSAAEIGELIEEANAPLRTKTGSNPGLTLNPGVQVSAYKNTYDNECCDRQKFGSEIKRVTTQVGKLRQAIVFIRLNFLKMDNPPNFDDSTHFPGDYSFKNNKLNA